MATATFEVSTYKYYDWSSRSTRKTNLILRGIGGETCSVQFTEDPAAALLPAVQSSSNFYIFQYHHHQLQHLIDMLRYEKPVYVVFDDSGGLNSSRISTTDEPVGEGEE